MPTSLPIHFSCRLGLSDDIIIRVFYVRKRKQLLSALRRICAFCSCTANIMGGMRSASTERSVRAFR